MTDPALEAGFRGGIENIDPDDWNRLAGGHDPFIGHDFLAAMEQSGSAGKRTGWQPLHLTVTQSDGMIAAAPLYGKSNSWGEYVFDHGWADAYERAGGSYYPKLQVAVPFTPVPGQRLLAHDLESKLILIQALRSQLTQTNASSLHITFCSEPEARLLAEQEFLIRRGIQYHWSNRGYRDFDDFLADLRSAKRKMIKKERRAVIDAGIDVQILTGREQINQALDAFYPFYLSTVDKRWGNAYLTKAFFKLLADRMGERVVIVAAMKDDNMVAAALNLRGQDVLYGRLWGCLDQYKFLHFEACYYAAIEFAITHGLSRVEAGAQGTHKLHRGYRPVWTHSAHLFREQGFNDAVAQFLTHEDQALDDHFDELSALAPFREAECTN